MKHFYTLLLFYFGFSYLNIFAQHIDNADSLLIRHYRNKVYPKSVTSISNNLYAGIDNDLEMVFPDEKSKTFKYHLTTNNGSLYKTDEGYLTIPKSAGRSFFTIYLINADKDTLMIGKKQFVVNNLPLASLKIGNSLIVDGAELNKIAFLRGDTLKLFFTDDLPESSEWYTIKSFSIGFTYGKKYLSADNEGALIGEGVKTLLSKVLDDRDIYIKVNTVAPSGILRFLPIKKIKLISQVSNK